MLASFNISVCVFINSGMPIAIGFCSGFHLGEESVADPCLI